MAYQPKFNRAPEPVKKASPTKVLVVLAAVLVSLLLTAGALALMFLNLGRPGAMVEVKTTNLDMMQTFDERMAQDLDALRLSLQPQKPEETVTPGEEVVEEKKIYTLRDEDLVAPEPNQTLFGKTNDRAVLKDVIAQAAEILEGQTLYFDPDNTQFLYDEVRYYLDDSIFAITWKEGHEDICYTFSEVKVAHASQFRRHMADGEYGSDKQYYTTEMAQSVNAVVASSGDFYRFKNFGAVVYQGQARRVDGKYAETCYIDNNGDMSFTYAGEVRTRDDVQTLVDDKGIRFSLCFGPILVDNYELVEHSWYGIGEINEPYARAALCQMDKLHYLVAAANYDQGFNTCPNVALFQKHIAATGCKMAYSLDGGQTAAIVMNDELINRPAKGEQRRISDIIYFATAIPEGG